MIIEKVGRKMHYVVKKELKLTDYEFGYSGNETFDWIKTIERNNAYFIVKNNILKIVKNNNRKQIKNLPVIYKTINTLLADGIIEEVEK